MWVIQKWTVHMIQCQEHADNTIMSGRYVTM